MDVTDVGSINGLDLGRSGHGFKYQLGRKKICITSHVRPSKWTPKFEL